MSNDQQPDAPEGREAASLPFLRYGAGPFDVTPYMDDLKDFDMTEEEKVAFLEALCLIMKTFVDIGWGVDSIQRVFPALIEEEGQEEASMASQVGEDFTVAAHDKREED